jgi:HK97 family phage portal protein
LGLFNRIFRNKTPTSGYKLITEHGNGFYLWNGKLYESDIIRSCIRPTSHAVGKLTPKHIRKGTGEKSDTVIFPEPYMRILLEDPNPLMSFQMLIEKMINQLELNNNAFALITRDENGYPSQIWPLIAYNVQMELSDNGEMQLKFYLSNGKTPTYLYRDIIHLRKDFNANDVFGESPAEAIKALMDITTAEDQSMLKAAKTANVIRWLLKFSQTLKDEDLTIKAQEFNKNYLATDSEAGGAVPVNGNYEIEQVKADGYSPRAAQLTRTTARIYNFFNTNENIVQGKFKEDDWTAFYETKIEPLSKQMSSEFTRKLFSRKERAFGNKIIFDSMNLQYASMSTKLGLEKMVDRGAMTPNEWREVLNMGPVEGGDKAVRRKDTGLVEEGDNTNENDNA